MNAKEIPNNLFFSNIKDILNSGNSVELKIKGTSMHPTLVNGKHKVVLIPYRQQQIRIGTIALFGYRGKYILHRLISISEDHLIFQGDNLPSVREYVEEKDVVAIVEFIITPAGKIIDYKKFSPRIKDRLRRSLYQYYLMCIIKLKRFGIIHYITL
ncbi:S24/S26 family peptidase [Dysgonomonas termitidis]|uniref:S24/S26 family peptidase n=1 Tax=Dysgonomonas termitidis TaxID=1516126 RepID=A0ABV9KUG3_9BACT